MPRSPHAAKTLIKLLQDSLGRSADSEAGLGTAEPVGDPDGLGVYRSYKFDTTASKVLAKHKAALEADPRIVSVSGSKNVTVEFHAGVRADSRDPFDLDVQAAEDEAGA